MRTIARKKTGVMIIDQTPSCRDFRPKALKRYRQLIEHVKKTPVLNSTYEMNIARQKEKSE